MQHLKSLYVYPSICGNQVMTRENKDLEIIKIKMKVVYTLSSPSTSNPDDSNTNKSRDSSTNKSNEIYMEINERSNKI